MSCRRLWTVAVPLACAVLGLASPAVPASPSQDGRQISHARVVFEVSNVNRSRVPCPSDGQAYEVEAALVGPASLLEGREPAAVTLYVHGLGLTSYYWRFPDAPGLDHVAEMARAGHVGLVYDRLGYGASPKPTGLQSCYGSEADIAAQLVRALKAGDYRRQDGPPVAFGRVAVASHSQAGLIAQPMAYSFSDADALIITSWTDEGNRPEVTQAVFATAQTCLTGGVPDRPPFYAFFPEDDATFRELYFHGADPAVVSVATSMREPDPCGNGGSLAQTLLADQALLATIDLPTLLVYGTEDGYRDPAAGRAHAAKFSGSPDVTVEFLADSGNAIALEPAAREFRLLLGRWLCDRGLAAPRACSAIPAPDDEGSQPAAGSPTPTTQDHVARDLPPRTLADTGLWPAPQVAALLAVTVLLLAARLARAS